MKEPTLRIAYVTHASSTFIVEEFSDGSTRQVKRPESIEKMDEKRRRYGAKWRSIIPIRLLPSWREANGR
jgi:hypothetical protein